LSPKGTIDYKNLFLNYWADNPAGEGTNVLGSDFNMFSTFEDAKSDKNPWTFCNYNAPGYPRDCGPSGYVPYEWNSLTNGGETEYAFYLFTGEE